MDNSFINQYPYLDFHELNLDWIINQTKNLKLQVDAIQEEFNKIKILTEEQIEEMINEAIDSNNLIIFNALTKLRTQITNEYTAYVRTQIEQLTAYIDSQDTYFDNLARSYATAAEDAAKQYTDEKVLNYTMMINPITGDYDDVRVVVTDIVTYFLSDNSLTASEYDALELTAQAYDNYKLTAFDYDFNAKNLLI